MKKNSNKIILGIPDNPEVKQAVGELAIAHGNMEMIFIYCLKTIEDVKPIQAMKQYRNSSGEKKGKKISTRGRITRILDNNVPETPPYSEAKEKINDYIEESWKLTHIRDRYLHCFWGKRNDSGNWEISTDHNIWKPLPAADEITKHAKEISKFSEELNKERLNKNGAFEFIRAKLSKA